MLAMMLQYDISIKHLKLKNFQHNFKSLIV